MKIQSSPYKITDRTGSTPNAVAVNNSVLDLESTTRGFLPPRMTTTQRDAVTWNNTTDKGMVIYNTTTNKLQCWNGTTWNDLF